MFRSIALSVLICFALNLAGAERSFSFAETNVNQAPPGFRSAVMGSGKPGEWKIVIDEVPPLIPTLTSGAVTPKRPVLAQLARDPSDEHYPLLIYDDETYSDFKLSTRFKTVAGVVEQMAGMAFRLQNETNYYYVRGSSLGNTFRFFKIVNGERSAPIGPEIPVEKGIWHQLDIQCTGNKIRCWLDEKEVFPELTDNSFSAGKIAFWTKSDSVSYFTDTKIVYTPHEALAKVLIREMKREYPRLLAMRIYSRKPELKVLASTNEQEVGLAGTTVEEKVFANDAPFYGKQKKSVLLTLPLHDRNGDVIAALRLEMESFRGQTEANALARAMPIVRQVEKRIHTSEDLL